MSQLFLKKWAKGLLEWLIFFPLLLYVGAVSFSGVFVFVWPVFLYLLFGFSLIVGMKFYFTVRWTRLIFACPFAILIPVIAQVSFITGFVLSLVILVVVNRGFYYSREVLEDLVSLRLVLFGFVLYFFATFLYRLYPVLTPFETVLNIIGILFVSTMLFYINRTFLKQVTLVERGKPFLSQATKRQNIFYLVSFISLLLFLVNGQFIQPALLKVWRTFIAFLNLFRIEGVESPWAEYDFWEEEEELISEIGMEEVIEKGPNMALIIGIIISSLFVFLFLILLLHFFRNSKSYYVWFKSKLIGVFNYQVQNQEEGFVDEEERLLSFKKWMRTYKAWLQTALERRGKFTDLETNQEKVRYLFTQLMLKEQKNGLKLQKSDTAHELLQQIIAQDREEKNGLYELSHQYHSARYGYRDIPDHEVEKLHQWIEKRQAVYKKRKYKDE
ncbi:hypothetical protein AJ85_01565 [Alkalihalobacillus alcalophilus ATCC 27647 = CGMCC 1.3604]|uniref:DUF4129 domain-containing protein n=1 Tax=Alkalihalobacillus alcalophilus ATCC 27647 = CGMCC 1.3604 TaxID=1218173 RepID=A0A094YTJ2_ALKAL|nr:DUF4129 domain-containing protein [Alkalihalobacillus alcalophilus]KGA96762.1 hypothetical protein BALCAV_0214195 [Alkalihalobacillus alcalophilus ATCC 27647 = CGMCC 1.3604]MED1561791.1 DUF4129 domain-containing protein [Alkalihalobacillus alcalophilus]THG91806.1 hypothetical protein AJ85_01565 [Alkalihalobacillus alcalophilus ATCC 27647 = CGMCC 1.3604]